MKNLIPDFGCLTTRAGIGTKRNVGKIAKSSKSCKLLTAEKEVDFFDTDYNLLGKASLDTVYKEGLWHQSAHAWIFNSSGNIIFQLRSKDIVNYPNRLDVSSGGCVDLGYTPYQTVLCETKEELGIDVSKEDVLSVGYRVCQSKNESRIYNVFDNLFMINHEAPIMDYNIQEDELGGVFSMAVTDVEKLLNNEVNEVKINGFIIRSGEQIWGTILAGLQHFVPFRRAYYHHMVGTIKSYLGMDKAKKYHIIVGHMFNRSLQPRLIFGSEAI